MDEIASIIKHDIKNNVKSDLFIFVTFLFQCVNTSCNEP
jgi:hypothetical protein